MKISFFIFILVIVKWIDVTIDRQTKDILLLKEVLCFFVSSLYIDNQKATYVSCIKNNECYRQVDVTRNFIPYSLFCISDQHSLTSHYIDVPYNDKSTNVPTYQVPVVFYNDL